MLHAAAATFEVTPQIGSEGGSLLGHRAEIVFTPLKNSLVILESDGQRIALLTSHFMTHEYPTSNLFRQGVAEVLGIPIDQTLSFSSHNHCDAVLVKDREYAYGVNYHDDFDHPDMLTREGRLLLEGYINAARQLRDRLVPVTMAYGVGHERRITHNRKGRRADGSTYFMREEDRLRLGVDFNGDIDDDAFVIGFFDQQQKPVCMLTQFTGHPVTAFHCERPVVHGEFPQVACDDLSEAFGGVPVAFLQGCAGDVNSKGLLSAKPPQDNARDADRFGHLLGDTFKQVAGNLCESQRHDLALAWRWVDLPFKELPSRDALTERLENVRVFLARCDANDEPSTRECDGLNFPTNMTPAYRKELIEPTRQWLLWALRFHDKNRLDEVPKQVALKIATLRIGDVGIVGMPCEPLLGIGRRIKQCSALPMTVPCGYMNDCSVAYVPDGANCDDHEYVSSFYRYSTVLLPYRKPAGDLLADAAVQMLAPQPVPTHA